MAINTINHVVGWRFITYNGELFHFQEESQCPCIIWAHTMRNAQPWKVIKSHGWTRCWSRVWSHNKNKNWSGLQIKPIIHDYIHSCFWLILEVTSHDLQRTRHSAPDPMNFMNKKYIKVFNILSLADVKCTLFPNLDHLTCETIKSFPVHDWTKTMQIWTQAHTLPRIQEGSCDN